MSDHETGREIRRPVRGDEYVDAVLARREVSSGSSATTAAKPASTRAMPTRSQPGHDATVVGDVDFVGVDFSPAMASAYAKPS